MSYSLPTYSISSDEEYPVSLSPVRPLFSDDSAEMNSRFAEMTKILASIEEGICYSKPIRPKRTTANILDELHGIIDASSCETTTSFLSDSDSISTVSEFSGAIDIESSDDYFDYLSDVSEGEFGFDFVEKINESTAVYPPYGFFSPQDIANRDLAVSQMWRPKNV